MERITSDIVIEILNAAPIRAMPRMLSAGKKFAFYWKKSSIGNIAVR